ncbi:hypothetical protein [Streptomyces sp. NPDC006355]|uniref:hypothetical protein n=1 Tax=Streptomyces sp. NPDC006355 TaxID=3156758 RepID=UPI0033AB7187
MSTEDLTCLGGVAITLLETFPLWGPVLALVAVWLLWQALCVTWLNQEDGQEDTGGHAVLTVSPAVPAEEDATEDTLTLRRVTCGDTVPPVSPERETGGA